MSLPPERLHATHLSWSVVRIVYHAAILWLLADLWAWRASAFAAHREVGAALVSLGLVVNLLLGRKAHRAAAAGASRSSTNVFHS